MKRRLTLPQSNKFYIWLYVLFHCAAILPFLISLAVGRGLNVDADLFNMLPRSTEDRAIALSDELLTKKNSPAFFILVSHEDFETAKSVAQTVYGSLKDSPKFSSLTLYSDTSVSSDISNFIHQYRWNLLSASDVEELSTEEERKQFANNALASAYGAFTVASLDRLEEDPFLLDEVALRHFLSSVQNGGTAMSAKDGLLASLYEGRWYIMIQGALSREGEALASSSNGISLIYSICSPLEKDGVRFVYSGTPFHSHESSTSAQKEITLISVLSFSAVIIMLIFVFRSPVPLFASLASILISIAAGVSATHFVFGKLHVLTLVFGTSLIGSCIDYSLHYFVNWKGNALLKNGAQIRSHLVRGLTLSLVSTEICYGALMFAPFALLKQMALFSMTGIMSSFLTVLCVYPLCKLPPQSARTLPLLKFYRPPSLAKKNPKLGVFISLALLLLCGTAMFFCHDHVRVLNDIRGLYVMKGCLAQDTVLSNQVIRYSPSSWFVVSGNSEQEVLEKEEEVCAGLLKLKEENAVGGFAASSLFIPSIKTQKKSYDAVSLLLPLAQVQYEMLGYDEKSFTVFKDEYEGAKEKFLTPGAELPHSLSLLTDSLWIGESDGRYYSVIMPTSIADENACRSLAEQFAGVYFQNKSADIGHSLDQLTKIILLMFFIAFILITFVLKFFYRWRQTAKIASIPILSIAVIVAVFALSGKYLEFFGVTGMILVFGLGLDYVIYMTENSGQDKLEPFAILLSFLTTALSFGALALSSFVPVHTLGLSIFLGLVTAFAATLF